LSNYKLDNVQYPIRDQLRIPAGYTKVPVTLRPLRGEETKATIVAGVIGKSIRPGAPAGYVEELALLNSTLLASIQASIGIVPSQLQPTSAWLMYGPSRFSGEVPVRMTGDGDPERKRLPQVIQCANNQQQIVWMNT